MNIIKASLFKIFDTKTLIRVGNPNNKLNLKKENGDGGYTVEKKSVINSRYLISLGRGEDISFEMEFLSINNKAKVCSYDGSTNLFFLIKFFLKTFIKLVILEITLNNFFNKTKQLFFFNKKNKFYKYFIYPDNFSSPQSKNIISLNNILKRFKNRVFLKIDIEGGEYRILDEIIKNQNVLEGLVIEFHDVDLHLKEILDFHKKLNLKIIYISPNNVSAVNQYKFPTVIEFSYSKYYLRKLHKKKIFPLKKLAYSNNVKYKKAFIKFI